MLGYCMITTIITLLVSEQETNANNYQNIKGLEKIQPVYGERKFLC